MKTVREGLQRIGAEERRGIGIVRRGLMGTENKGSPESKESVMDAGSRRLLDRRRSVVEELVVLRLEPKFKMVLSQALSLLTRCASKRK